MSVLRRWKPSRCPLVIAGVDEAGRGPLAGPVTAAAVAFPPGYHNAEINDSKQLVHEQRQELSRQIRKAALGYAIVSVGPRRIERLNILRASLLAMRLSALRLREQLSAKGFKRQCYFLVDGNWPFDNEFLQEPIIQGDAKILQIAAASILAKVHRDSLMDLIDRQFPSYGFKDHKGYGVSTHREQIKKSGPCRVHRKTFAGVCEYYGPLDLFAQIEISAVPAGNSTPPTGKELR
jgi:ribonuclease HII